MRKPCNSDSGDANSSHSIGLCKARGLYLHKALAPVIERGRAVLVHRDEPTRGS